MKSLPKLLLIIFLLSSALGYGATEDEAIDQLRTADISVVRRVAKSLAEVMAKNSPQHLDSETVLTGAMFIQEPPIVAVSMIASADMSKRDLEAGAKYLVCSNRLANVLMSRGIKFQYNYRMPSGLVRVDLDMTKCSK